MSVQIEIDTTAFTTAINRLVEHTGKTGMEVLRQQAKLFVRDARAFTPPTGNSPVVESQDSGLQSQKRAGEGAIVSDLHKLFKLVDDMKMVSQPTNQALADRMRKYAQQGNVEAVESIFRRSGITAPVYREASAIVHKYARNKRGRVRDKASVFILRKRGIVALRQGLFKKLGQAKAGWNAAARSLGLGVPAWVSRHGGSGMIQQDPSPTTPSITIANLVGYAQKHERGMKDGIVRRALARRVESMTNQLNHMLGKTFQGYNAK